MRILSIVLTMILAFLVPVSSVSAERFLPEVDSTQTGYVFYGGGQGQQAWFVSVLTFPTDSPSVVLDALDDIFGMTVSDTFVWTRVSGNVWTQNPEQAMDYIVGADFQKGDTSDFLNFYLRQERVVFANPHINNNYTGIGTKWSGENISAEVFASTDMNDSYKMSFYGQYDPTEDLTLSTNVWYLLDDDPNDSNGWGWWRVMAENQLDETSSIVFVYEDSTRSDPLYLVGFGYDL